MTARGASKLPDNLDLKVDESKVCETDKPVFRASKAAHAASAATARLLARQSIDRLLDSAQQQSDGEPVRLGPEVLSQNDAPRQ